MMITLHLFLFFIVIFLSDLMPVAANMGDNILEGFMQNLAIRDKDYSAMVIDLNVSYANETVNSSKLGKFLDNFLMTRPWWWIDTENVRSRKGADDKQRKIFRIILRRFSHDWDKLFAQFIHSQFPLDCRRAPLNAMYSTLFNSFGNSWYNYINNKEAFPSAVIAPVLYGQDISFLDKNSCAHKSNRFECAFIPTTNCSVPILLQMEPKRVDNNMFASADVNAIRVDDMNVSGSNLHEKFSEIVNIHQQSHLFLEVPPSVKDHPLCCNTSSGLFKNGEVSTTFSCGPTYGRFFGYSFLFRPNYHFRALINHIIMDWKKTLSKPFPDNGDCVVAIIRRTDRSADGNEDMIKWCERHKPFPNGTCYNTITQIADNNINCSQYGEYGCHTGMPYGGMTLEKVLKATRVVSQSKNILVRCDEENWLIEQIKSTNTELNIFPFTPPPNHRSSTMGGANYMAAVKLSRQCSALVGHTGSAVTMFTFNAMCIQRNEKYGYCPQIYDFANG